jgi:hypothetical protein
MTQGTGNINYSLNKNDFYKIITGALIAFLPNYYILVFISLIYLYTIRFKKYYFPDREEKYRTEEDTMHFYKSITYKSPLHILNLLEENIDKEKFVGLSNFSYSILIISYIISLIIILEGLIRNLIYSIYINVIQINKNNNPYKNNRCITKINENANISVAKNYSAITSLSINYLIPFLIPFLINFMNFDNYDIKHSSWFNYVILFIIFYPFLIIIISRGSFHKKLEIFSELKRFINPNDYKFVDDINHKFYLNMHTIVVFLLIIFIFCYYKIIYSDFKYTLLKKIIIYILIALIIFGFIPAFILFFALNSVLNNKNLNNSESEIINNIKKNGLSGLYDLLVKYNYPCFKI